MKISCFANFVGASKLFCLRTHALPGGPIWWHWEMSGRVVMSFLLLQEERQQPAQLGESKTAAPECLDSHVGNASSCLGGAPSRKRGASAASNSNMQDNKRAKTSNVAAFDNTAAHAAGGLQRGQHFGATGRGQAGPGTEGATFGEMFGQHSKESAEEEMMSLGDSSDEQEVAKALLGMGSMVA